MTSELPEIAHRIRAVVDRYEEGNVSAFARKLGLSQRGAAKLHNGETPSPGYRVLAKICKRYPVDPTWLLTGKSSKLWSAGEERAEIEGYRIATEMLRMFITVLESPDQVATRLRTIAQKGGAEMESAAKGMMELAKRIQKVS